MWTWMRLWLSSLIMGLIVICCIAEVSAESGDAGQAGASLRTGVGARPLAMGGAFAAIADDATAVYWNPAGLVQLEKKEISSMYAISSLDRKYNFLNYAIPMENKELMQAIAISVINSGVDNLREREKGTDMYLGEFDEVEYALLISYARVIWGKMAFGLNFKYLHHNFVGIRQVNPKGESEGSGVGLDFGLLYKLSDDVLVGLMCQDVGTFLKWRTERVDYLPLDVRLGCSVSLLRGRLILALEGEKIEDRKGTKLHLGTEYWLLDGTVGLRAGVNDTYPCVGLGVKLPVPKATLHLDYGFGTDKFTEFKEEIKSSERYNHRFSLRVQF